ncbi:hypothetical protein CEY09_27420 [Achromobacter marplatensis]|uniref:Uncharacterized protein DUF3806 n=1 Tax=Achromobacter marplatensis TaxID=470868 RepID=A0ABX9G5F5_9BURK|nr:DUF3806 domain-containing protein [Achromobacter marplatensis]OWT58102.1 hypothetical protein CEY09_27420 [Achromobacter marplatensis]RBP14515.1 uncharacterized protein DUF3806 [Achromobacter marplatensis]CAB3700287.1 hypothetical protein LMG26219_05311 [Achromobacter marplatensis]
MSEDIEAEFQPLPASMLEHMQSRRALLHAWIAHSFPGDELRHTAADFDLLQRIVDAGILTAEDVADWEAMGIAFGDGLTTLVPGLAWAQVTDQFGTDAVLRYRQTSLQIGVVTMLLKRAEEDEAIDIAHMAQWLQAFIEEKAHEYQ